jgi:hypothetical protein
LPLGVGCSVLLLVLSQTSVSRSVDLFLISTFFYRFCSFFFVSLPAPKMALSDADVQKQVSLLL